MLPLRFRFTLSPTVTWAWAAAAYRSRLTLIQSVAFALILLTVSIPYIWTFPLLQWFDLRVAAKLLVEGGAYLLLFLFLEIGLQLCPGLCKGRLACRRVSIQADHNPCPVHLNGIAYLAGFYSACSLGDFRWQVLYVH